MVGSILGRLVSLFQSGWRNTTGISALNNGLLCNGRAHYQNETSHPTPQHHTPIYVGHTIVKATEWAPSQQDHWRWSSFRQVMETSHSLLEGLEDTSQSPQGYAILNIMDLFMATWPTFNILVLPFTTFGFISHHTPHILWSECPSISISSMNPLPVLSPYKSWRITALLKAINWFSFKIPVGLNKLSISILFIYPWLYSCHLSPQLFHPIYVLHLFISYSLSFMFHLQHHDTAQPCYSHDISYPFSL